MPATVKEFTRWLSKEVHEDVEDVAIQCSEYPAMYIRMQEWQESEIKMIKIALYEYNFRIPRISPRREYDDDYDDVYKYENNSDKDSDNDSDSNTDNDE